MSAYYDAQEINRGDHACSIYTDKTQQHKVLVRYMLAGLNQENERCICLVSKNTQDDLCRHLSSFGIDIEKDVEKRQLVFFNTESFYLQDGIFSAARILDAITFAHYEALKDGYTGIRGGR